MGFYFNKVFALLFIPSYAPFDAPLSPQTLYTNCDTELYVLKLSTILVRFFRS